MLVTPVCNFLRRATSHFLPREKILCFLEEIPSFQIIQERSCAGAALFGKIIFSDGLKEISYLCVFFCERSSFIFRPRYKTIFSGKINIMLLDNARKIIFQRNVFGKTIFSGRLEKENMVFRAVFVISCRYLVNLYFSFPPFHLELLNKLCPMDFGSLWLVHGKLKHWSFGTIPNVLQFNEKFKSSDALSYLIWTFSKLCSSLTNTSPSWCFDMKNTTLPKFLTHVRLAKTWI